VGITVEEEMGIIEGYPEEGGVRRNIKAAGEELTTKRKKQGEKENIGPSLDDAGGESRPLTKKQEKSKDAKKKKMAERLKKGVDKTTLKDFEKKKEGETAWGRGGKNKGEATLGGEQKEKLKRDPEKNSGSAQRELRQTKVTGCGAIND